VQKPHAIKGKEIDCKKALRKSQLPPSKKLPSQFQGGGSRNGRGDYDEGFEGKYIDMATAVVFFFLYSLNLFCFRLQQGGNS
jgi:hypothetical protein